MNVTEFGQQYKVKVTNPNQKSWSLKTKMQLDDGPVVEGRCGMISNLLPREARTDSNRLVLSLLAVPRNADMNKKLATRARDAKAAGMTLKVQSGYESEWYFDPNDPVMATAAIKAVGARRRRSRNLTDDQKAALAVRLASARVKNTVETVSL